MRRFALAAFAAASLTLSAPAQTTDVDGLIARLPGVAIRYDAKTEADGVVALDNVTIAAKKADGSTDEETKVFIKRAELTGLDAEAILSVFDAGRYGAEPDQTFRRLAAQIALSEVSFIAGGKPVATIGEWTVDGVEMKQFWFKPGGPDYAAQFSSDKERAAKIIGNILDSLKIGPSRVARMHFDYAPAMLAGLVTPPGMPPSYTAAGGTASYDYAEITGEGFDRGRWGKVTFSGISGKSPVPGLGDMEITLADGYWDGFDLTKLLPWLMRAEWPPVEREGLLSYGAACGRDYVIKLPKIGALAFPEACTEPVEFAWLIPLHIKAAIAGTFTPVPAAESALPPYVARHFDAPAPLEILIEAAYDPDAGAAMLSHYRLRLGGFGAIDLGGAAGGLQLGGLAVLPATYAQTLTFTGARLEVADEGGRDKFFAMAADAANAQAGGQGEPVTPDALKAQAKMGLDMGGAMLAGSPQGAALIQTMKDFIDQGGTLVVTLAPPAPMTLADFGALTSKAPAEWLAALGLSAERR